MGGYVGAIPAFYQDAAVIAYRLPKNDKTLKDLKPILTSSGGTFSLEDLTDGNLNNTQVLPPKQAGEEIWIQYAFEAPQTIKAFSVTGANHTAMETFNGGPTNRSLQVSDDGISFREVAQISGDVVILASWAEMEPHEAATHEPTIARRRQSIAAVVCVAVRWIARFEHQTPVPEEEEQKKHTTQD